MAQKKAKKKNSPKAPKKAAKAQKTAAKPAKAKAAKVVKSQKAAKKTPAKTIEAKKVTSELPPVVEAKQTKKEAMKASPTPFDAKQAKIEAKAEAKKEKEIVKAKKALGKAKQNLAKARVKDLGSKLGKNLVSQGVDELAKKWESLFKRADSIESKPYRMKDSFEERTAIEHKILGWGFVLSNQNDRLEVLFRDGIRYLISNYKA